MIERARMLDRLASEDLCAVGMTKEPRGPAAIHEAAHETVGLELMHRPAVPFQVIEARGTLRRFLAGEVVAEVEERCPDDAARLDGETRIGKRFGDVEALERQFASGSDVTGEQMVFISEVYCAFWQHRKALATALEKRIDAVLENQQRRRALLEKKLADLKAEEVRLRLEFSMPKLSEPVYP